MSRKSEIFESVLTSAYDNNAFVGFVQELLNNVELVAPNAYKKVYNNFSSSIAKNIMNLENIWKQILNLCRKQKSGTLQVNSLQRNC